MGVGRGLEGTRARGFGSQAKAACAQSASSSVGGHEGGINARVSREGGCVGGASTLRGTTCCPGQPAADSRPV